MGLGRKSSHLLITFIYFIMENQLLGKSGIRVSPLAFGGNVFGWTLREDKEVFRILDAFTEAGGNFIDTADSYSRWVPGNHGGESETLIGKWLKRKKDRHSVVIATKVGSDMGQGKKDLSAKHILQSVEDSLKRLQTEYIDLYQAHYDDPVTPMEQTLETFGSLIKSGKVRIIGASNFSAQRLKMALDLSEQKGYPRYETLQPLYNLYDRKGFESEFLEICQQNKLGVITYSSLASGFLSGKYRSENDFSKSSRGKGVAHYLDTRGLRILDALDEVAARHQVQPATIALAWLISRPTVLAPIASATTLNQLDELTRAVSLKLDADSVQLLDQASGEEQV